MSTLLIPREVDRLFRYPRGRAMRLARKNQLAHITLPDGEVRFDAKVIDAIINGTSAVPPVDQEQEVAHA